MERLGYGRARTLANMSTKACTVGSDVVEMLVLSRAGQALQVFKGAEVAMGVLGRRVREQKIFIPANSRMADLKVKLFVCSNADVLKSPDAGRCMGANAGHVRWQLVH